MITSILRVPIFFLYIVIGLFFVRPCYSQNREHSEKTILSNFLEASGGLEKWSTISSINALIERVSYENVEDSSELHILNSEIYYISFPKPKLYTLEKGHLVSISSKDSTFTKSDELGWSTINSFSVLGKKDKQIDFFSSRILRILPTLFFSINLHSNDVFRKIDLNFPESEKYNIIIISDSLYNPYDSNTTLYYFSKESNLLEKTIIVKLYEESNTFLEIKGFKYEKYSNFNGFLMPTKITPFNPMNGKEKAGGIVNLVDITINGYIDYNIISK